MLGRVCGFACACARAWLGCARSGLNAFLCFLVRSLGRVCGFACVCLAWLALLLAAGQKSQPSRRSRARGFRAPGGCPRWPPKLVSEPQPCSKCINELASEPHSRSKLPLEPVRISRAAPKGRASLAHFHTLGDGLEATYIVYNLIHSLFILLLNVSVSVKEEKTKPCVTWLQMCLEQLTKALGVG